MVLLSELVMDIKVDRKIIYSSLSLGLMKQEPLDSVTIKIELM